VLIKIATEEVVLLVPTKVNSNEKNFKIQSCLSNTTPKALQILLRDPEIIKLGVGIEENLLALWTEFELESNSWTELNELIPQSNLNFGDMSSKKVSLSAMATRLGYRDWKIDHASRSWESWPVTLSQLHQAAEDALMIVRVFWGLMDGRVSKLMTSSEIWVIIENLVDRLCKQLPISRLDKKQRIAKLKKDLLSSSDFGESHNRNERKDKSSHESNGGGTANHLEGLDYMRSLNVTSSQKYLDKFFPWV